MKKRALVFFSGGLDSRVTAKFLEELGFDIVLCSVKLPFFNNKHFEEVLSFSHENNFPLYIIDVTKGELLKNYLNVIKKPKYGFGVGINPCKDCRIFIFREGKKIADKIHADLIATGEVLAQRPMSQMKNGLIKIDEDSGLTGKILRPLSAKLLPETIYEINGIIEREKLLKIQGKRRNGQIKMAEKYKINFPEPTGGCLLCEKTCANKLKFLFNYKKDLILEELLLLNKGRMFKNNGIILVGRNKDENLFLEEINSKLNWNIFINQNLSGPTIIYDNILDEDFVLSLWNIFTSKDLDLRKKLDKFKI